MTHAFRLNIANLPSKANLLLPGCIYAIAHNNHLPMGELIWQTLLNATEQGQGVWITREEPEHLLANLEQDARTDQLLDNGRLRIYRLSALSVSNPCANMSDELSRFGVGSQSLVIVDNAIAFTNSQAKNSFASFLRHCQHETDTSGRTLVLFYPYHEEHAELIRELLQSANRLAGLAHVLHMNGQTTWDVSHWFSSHGIEGRQTFRLDCQPSGWRAENLQASTSNTPSPRFNKQEVFLTRASLSGSSMPHQDWQIIDDIQALAEATRGAHNATVILHLDRNSDAHALARIIFDLRNDLGNGASIIIREINIHTRHVQQRLLLHAGADIIVPAEVRFSWIESLIEMLNQHIRVGEITTETNELPNDILPNRSPGYLLPDVFAREVRETLQRSRKFAIHNVLIQLFPAHGIVPSDIISQCALKRHGDLCTDNGHELFIFLFACRESDLDKTLDQLFLAQRADLFENETRFFNEDTMLDLLDSLAHANATPVHDITNTQPAVTAISPGQFRQPRTAVRRPLSLSTTQSGDFR